MNDNMDLIDDLIWEAERQEERLAEAYNNKEWITNEDEVIPIQELELSHLCNILNMLNHRKGIEHLQCFKPLMEDEMIRRGYKVIGRK